MKKVLHKLKSWKFMLGFVLLVTAVGIGGLSAYLTDADQANNDLTIGGNRIEIVEEFTPPKELKPGTEFTKDVSVKNVGPNDCFVRIKAVFTDSDMEKYCTVKFNSSEDKDDDTVDYWYNAEDGYYYLKDILKSGVTSPSLFTNVTLSSDIPADEIKDFDILVYTESYQSEGFTDYMAAWEHYARKK